VFPRRRRGDDVNARKADWRCWTRRVRQPPPVHVFSSAFRFLFCTFSLGVAILIIQPRRLSASYYNYTTFGFDNDVRWILFIELFTKYFVMKLFRNFRVLNTRQQFIRTYAAYGFSGVVVSPAAARPGTRSATRAPRRIRNDTIFITSAYTVRAR